MNCKSSNFLISFLLYKKIKSKIFIPFLSLEMQKCFGGNRNLDVAQIVKKNAFFASIGRMGRINTKTIFFGLYLNILSIDAKFSSHENSSIGTRCAVNGGRIVYLKDQSLVSIFDRFMFRVSSCYQDNLEAGWRRRRYRFLRVDLLPYVLPLEVVVSLGRS